MSTIVLKTNMSCEKCVAKVKPALEAEGIKNALKFDMRSSNKTVTFEGSEAQENLAISALKNLGYQASSLKDAQVIPAKTSTNFFEIYKPLIVVGLFLVGLTALVEIKADGFDATRAMNVFMGGFFIFFSFFKFLDLRAFADAYSTYDIIAKKSRVYALAYPFIELALGVNFILNAFPVFVNVATIVLMIIGNLGVWNVIRKKQAIQCACLGTIFKLPMTKVTMFENTLMLIMACIALTSLI